MVLKGINLGLACYNFYSKLKGSYAHWSFGKAVGAIVAETYLLVRIGLDWQGMVRTRSFEKRLYYKMKEEKAAAKEEKEGSEEEETEADTPDDEEFDEFEEEAY